MHYNPLFSTMHYYTLYPITRYNALKVFRIFGIVHIISDDALKSNALLKI